MAKTVVVDFTDQTQKPYTNVPDAILSDKDKAGREIVSRAKKIIQKKKYRHGALKMVIDSLLQLWMRKLMLR